ncbi:WG repeat-containing protein [Thalassotalea sp. PS06]|uniref:WG repeat-containing protein n=1 Tax=Thalassotalea sp. PS06 TaxID=2594005 RepID=UPI0011631CD1|nr:WG repeat-containing protein [Thalassotalea sp. PS06]QDP01292.1 WG repeat-containing protein [Thalassotalea sp. PS06]
MQFPGTLINRLALYLYSGSTTLFLTLIAMLMIAMANPALAFVKKTLAPKELRYDEAFWQGKDEESGFEVGLEISSNLSLGIIKNDPFYLCSGTWRLQTVSIPEIDASLAGVPTELKISELPAQVVDKLALQQAEVLLALDKQNNYRLDCLLGKFSPSNNSSVSNNMPVIADWEKFVINGVDEQYVNATLAKDVVYGFVGTLRKDTTAKIAQYKPQIIDLDLDLSALKIWLAEQAQHKLLQSGSYELLNASDANLAYDKETGFDDIQFDLFIRSLYEQKRVNEGTEKIEQQFTVGPLESKLENRQGYLNRTCASSASLQQVVGSWFSGTSMFKLVEKCHNKVPDYGFVRTEHCAVQNTDVLAFDDISESAYCKNPLMQFVSLKDGSAVSQASYLDTSGFSNIGLAAVQGADNEWQVITNGFNTVKTLPDITGFKGGFHNERIIFRSSNGLYGAMDTSFNIVIPPKFEEIQSFSSKITRVKMRDRYGVIDRSGEWVVPAKFNQAGFVENGHILVREDKQLQSPWLLINSQGILIKQTDDAGQTPPSMQALLK